MCISNMNIHIAILLRMYKHTKFFKYATTKNYLATNSAGLFGRILGLLFPHGNGRFSYSYNIIHLKNT